MTAPDAPITPDLPDNPTSPESADDADTFPRDYVERLRAESAEHRVRAKRADDLAAKLHAARVAATGRLADPADLPYAEDLLDDDAALTAALDDLIASKPHLASRIPRGDVDQGIRETPDAPKGWGSLFKQT
ncbi:hypothetical protein CLV47_10738 [Antricoccus suffuscus]|uniref:Uncharacterized protein n=1 Tax=Antricoccus suffuscus TaxID=1629062 RepID=A0A2T0ZZZ3_9ACTN|nr:hypothetical protein [Antricoccus suffuscus]PRZ41912.1 hypothetical protein CLV47_10738 [Antricoccus suffuscus]